MRENSSSDSRGKDFTTADCRLCLPTKPHDSHCHARMHTSCLVVVTAAFLRSFDLWWSSRELDHSDEIMTALPFASRIALQTFFGGSVQEHVTT